jgi:hypothetical protein
MTKKLAKKQDGGVKKDTSAKAKAYISLAKSSGFKNDNKKAFKGGVDTTKTANFRAPWAPKRGQAGTMSIPLDAKKSGGSTKSKKK